jgi:hypothetical protein
MAIRLADDGFGGRGDDGLLSIMEAALGNSANRPRPGTVQRKESLTPADIQAIIMGSARETTTTAPYRGSMPHWIPPQVQGFVRKGLVDPYIGLGDPDTFRVFMGRERFTKRTKAKDIVQTRPDGTPVVFPGARPATVKRGSRDKTITVAQAMNEPYLWSEEQVQSAIERFQQAGFKDVATFDDVVQVWGGLVKRAGSMYSLSSGKRKVTPWDVLGLYSREIAAAQAKQGPPGPGDPGFNGRTTVVNKTIADVSEGEAWSALRGTISAMLGRDPSDQEVRDFSYRMGNLAARNPSISKTIQQYKDGQVVSTTTKQTDAGFTAADMAQEAYEKAQRDPDYAEYQAATTYFNAAVSALGAIGG